MTTTASQVAYKAADIIAERGLAKRLFQDSQGRVCLAGAVGLAICGDAQLANPFSVGTLTSRHSELMLAVWEASTAVLQERGHPASIWRFNDRDSTTAEDVILLLKETAVWLEGTS